MKYKSVTIRLPFLKETRDRKGTLHMKPCITTLNEYRNAYFRTLNEQKKQWVITVKEAFEKIGYTTVRLKKKDKNQVYLLKNHKEEVLKGECGRIKIVYHFPDNRNRDLDGNAIFAKYTLDAIIALGIFRDDNRNYIKFISQEVGADSKDSFGYFDFTIRFVPREDLEDKTNE